MVTKGQKLFEYFSNKYDLNINYIKTSPSDDEFVLFILDILEDIRKMSDKEFDKEIMLEDEHEKCENYNKLICEHD